MLPGASNSTYVDGLAYLQEQYSYSKGHLWRGLHEIAVFPPNEYFASLVNPLILGAIFIDFCGVLVPCATLNVFWR